MRFTRIKLKNWRNFIAVNLAFGERLFVAGPNACGKSNLLDAFRFLRDMAKNGGGLGRAVEERGGLTKLRCLAARKDPRVEIEVELVEGKGQDEVQWLYGIGIKQEARGQRRLLLTHERVLRNGRSLLDRPNPEDQKDDLRLTETHLEQVRANREFRPLAEAFQKILYLHLVPQLLKFPQWANRQVAGEDPFGVTFLDRVIKTPEKTRRSRLKKIEEALQVAVPELQELRDVRDDMGTPHLEAAYRHWRPNAGRQREDQFSDGTLRLIALLWTLLEGDGLLLLEEPELSLHSSIVSKLPALIWRLRRGKKRQVILSSHSGELFADRGIAAEDVALLKPRGSEGTEARLASDIDTIRDLLEGGMSVADAVLPGASPDQIGQLLFSFD